MAQPQPNVQVQPNNPRPPAVNQPTPTQAQPNVNRPPSAPNASQPNPYPNNQKEGNASDNANGRSKNRSYNDRPPSTRPTVDRRSSRSSSNNLRLRQQQDQERQNVEQSRFAGSKDIGPTKNGSNR
jgi:hypothetical protein